MGAKILLVTDNSENMAKLEMALDTRGHLVVPVRTLAQAFEQLESDSTIDAILCDLIFVTGDSFDFLKRVRADHLRSNLPFVFLVDEQAMLTDALRKAAAILGADKFIFMDSFDPHSVRCEIEAVLPEQMSTLDLGPAGADVNAEQPPTQ